MVVVHDKEVLLVNVEVINKTAVRSDLDFWVHCISPTILGISRLRSSMSPSTLKRNARRRQQFLENKKFRASSVEQPDLVDSTQSHSESICAPSSDPTDVEKSGLCDGYRKEKGKVQKVPPLKGIVNNQSSPKYRLHQLDGACNLSDEDGELSFCDDNQRSEHDDDPKIGQSTSCPNCDQPLISIFYQCHDPDPVQFLAGY